jgi:hypothetical protein
MSREGGLRFAASRSKSLQAVMQWPDAIPPHFYLAIAAHAQLCRLGVFAAVPSFSAAEHSGIKRSKSTPASLQKRLL